jgi:hypothetical protein
MRVPTEHTADSRAPAWLKRALLFALSAMMLTVSAAPAPFRLEPPPFLTGPQVSKSLMGTTYAYTSATGRGSTRLMITTMPAKEIRTRFGALTDLQCLNMFLGELRSTHERFFVVAMNQPLTVGPAQLLRFRWNGMKSSVLMTGVLSCGELNGYYYVVHFVDEVGSAVRSFPAIRSSLRTLSTTKP